MKNTDIVLMSRERVLIEDPDLVANPRAIDRSIYQHRNDTRPHGRRVVVDVWTNKTEIRVLEGDKRLTPVARNYKEIAKVSLNSSHNTEDSVKLITTSLLDTYLSPMIAITKDTDLATPFLLEGGWRRIADEDRFNLLFTGGNWTHYTFDNLEAQPGQEIHYAWTSEWQDRVNDEDYAVVVGDLTQFTVASARDPKGEILDPDLEAVTLTITTSYIDDRPNGQITVEAPSLYDVYKATVEKSLPYKAPSGFDVRYDWADIVSQRVRQDGTCPDLGIENEATVKSGKMRR